MTPDMLRERLRAVLDDAAKERGVVTCPMCHGEGKVERAVRSITQTDVAKAIGTTRTGITNFLAGRQNFTLPVGLRLMEWLDAQKYAPSEARHE